MSTTARAISDYLLTGMHHATPEGQAAIEAILAEHGRRNALTAYWNACVSDQLDSVRADLAAFFALLDLEEDSELTGKLFHPTRITSCRALDGQRINELLGRLKTFATSTP